MDKNQPVAEFLKNDPRTLSVFERFRIDFCCGGGKSLEEACSRADVSLDAVMGALGALDATSPALPAPPQELGALVDFVEATHHVYTREAIARIRPLMEKVARVHGANHPELLEVRTVVGALFEDLEPHLLKEERVLFPYLRALDEAHKTKTSVVRPGFGTVRNPIGMMHIEHERVGELLHALEEATRDAGRGAPFAPPSDACGSYTALYIALGDLVKDVRRHVFVENEVMFPLALTLEGQAS